MSGPRPKLGCDASLHVQQAEAGCVFLASGTAHGFALSSTGWALPSSNGNDQRCDERALMTTLLQFADTAPQTLEGRFERFEDIVERLDAIGLRFERWTASQPLEADASSEEILAAYAADIERLKRERGYKTADVVRMKRAPDDAGWAAKAAAARVKFLEEHTHSEDEVRFFVEGSGMFCFHLQGLVHLLVCERGDLLSVPAGTRHWFDMGSDPAFCAIRLFGSEAGWVADFTGDKLSADFCSYDQVRAQYATSDQLRGA
jgi:1,2-dihydroxy-3-keto-5-methylthiopentene dioxygenase